MSHQTEKQVVLNRLTDLSVLIIIFNQLHSDIFGK
jgi:hypothetical protein